VGLVTIKQICREISYFRDCRSYKILVKFLSRLSSNFNALTVFFLCVWQSLYACHIFSNVKIVFILNLQTKLRARDGMLADATNKVVVVLVVVVHVAIVGVDVPGVVGVRCILGA